MASKHLKERFLHSTDKWRCVKQFIKSNKHTPPSALLHNNKVVTSPKLIATIANNYFKEKVRKIREKFTSEKITPIDILAKLIPRNKNDFILPLITLEKMHKLIDAIKPTNARGHDNVTNRILKMLKKELSPLLVHLFNSIILTSTFPKIFKLSRIMPSLKLGKNPLDISSYRPLNNLISIEKLFESYWMENINIFLFENNIILDGHHGGRKKYSTTTALTDITHNIQYNFEKNRIVSTVSTDLTAAFDTVDTQILLNKIEHYGFRGGT